MTRRNRRGGGPFSSFFGTSTPETAQPAQPAQPMPAQPMPAQPVAQPVAQPAQPDGKEIPEAVVSSEAQVLTAPTPEEKRSGSMAIDNAVNQLYHLTPEYQNYHMRALINAIGICNSTEKARNNVVGVTTGTFEATQCGSQCKERSEKVKAALKELLRIGEGNDALGYIGSGRVTVNSVAYLGNSAASLLNKGRSLFTRNAQTGQVAQAGGRRTRRR